MADKKGLLERLKEGPVLGAEGYLFELERRGWVSAGAYVPEVVLDAPDAVKQLHREFLRAGAEVMVAFTYYGHRAKMRAVGKEDLLEDLNREAVRLAREVAAEGDALVAGNINNTWEYDPNDRAKDKVVRDMFEEQVGWAIDEGVDFFIAETFNHFGEALIANEVIKAAGLPALVSFTAKGDASYDNVPWVEACQRLADAGADVVGLNCARGPATMLPLLKEIRAAVDGYVVGQPVAYRTTPQVQFFQNLKDLQGHRSFPVALDPHYLTRYEMAEYAVQAHEMGINYIGVCCGGAPHYVRAMAEALGRTVPASKYSPDLSLHPVLGAQGAQQEKMARYIEDFKDR